MQQGFMGMIGSADPYPLYARLREAGPAVQVGPNAWAVSRYQETLFVLRNHALFSSSALAGGFGFGARSLIGTDPPDHTQMRNIVNRAFTPRMISALEPRIREITQGLIDGFVDSGETDLIRDLAIPVPVIIIAEILGIDSDRREDFKRWSDSFLFSGVAPGGEVGPAYETNRREFREYFEDIVEQRRRDPREDLISALTRAEEAESLSAAEVMAFVTLLLIAGNETTTNLIGNAVVALLAHPAEMERVRADLGLVPSLVEETLRWDSPVQLIMRSATRDVEIGGKTIPRGSMVMPMFASANRDERQFPDPDRFDITRSNARDHLSFGQGVHFCLGAPLARLEAQVVLEAIIDRLPGLQPAYDSVERLDSFLLRGPKRLPLTFGRAAVAARG